MPITILIAPLLSTPSVISRIFTIARFTQPRIMQLIGSPRYNARKPRRKAAGLPEYRSSANSISVMTPARRHKRAYKKTVSIPLITKFHQSQLPAIPFLATKPVTASGVSAANVVATIEVPANHHGTLRPDRKNSLVLPEALRA